MSFGIKIRKADTLFSRYLRLKHKRCEKCGRRGEGKDGIDNCNALTSGEEETKIRDMTKKIAIACVLLTISNF